MDKDPGTQPVEIGEIFCCLWAKIMLELVWGRAMAACAKLNLCARLPAGIEGAVHAVQVAWERMMTPEEALENP